MSSPELPGRGKFASAWDQYVEQAPAGRVRWPGDEWGDEALWRTWFERLFVAFGVAQWQRAIEIGQGSGKYTEMVLRNSGATVVALDVSARFQSVCAQRLATDITAGRLLLRSIDERDAAPLPASVQDLGWGGLVDAVYSIDTFVHLTTTQIVALLMSATRVLRPGGLFVATFADATSAAGQAKLIADVDRVMRAVGDPSTGCFHWTSPEILRGLATRCGYAVELCATDTFHGRDGQCVFRYRDPQAAAAAHALRRPD